MKHDDEKDVRKVCAVQTCSYLPTIAVALRGKQLLICCVRVFAACLAMLFPAISRAQADAATLEAYINDHKQVSSLLLARSTLEMSNQLLHDYSKTAAVDYKNLNLDLDRYARAFDIIDVLYQSLRTSVNAYSTYNNVSDRIGDYKRLLADYHDKCLVRGKISLSDTLVISVNYRMLERVLDEGHSLYRSVSDLILYATGAAACSTSDLMTVLSAINQSLDNIERHINKAYFDTFRYVQLRMSYWKESVYRTKTTREILQGSFSRWRLASQLNQYMQ